VTVPIVLVGHPVGVVHKGILDQPLKDLHVRGLPTEIPSDLRVPVAHLDIGNMLLVKDIRLPEGLSTTNLPDQVVVTIHQPIAEEEVEAAVAGAEEVAEPEVIGAAERAAREEAEQQESPEGRKEARKEPKKEPKKEKE
jgi:large subunit ribosomal protein L25